MTNSILDEIKGHYEKWNCDSFECHYSEGFQAGEKKAQKEFLEIIDKWEQDINDNEIIMELKRAVGK